MALSPIDTAAITPTGSDSKTYLHTLNDMDTKMLGEDMFIFSPWKWHSVLLGHSLILTLVEERHSSFLLLSPDFSSFGGSMPQNSVDKKCCCHHINRSFKVHFNLYLPQQYTTSISKRVAEWDFEIRLSFYFHNLPFLLCAELSGYCTTPRCCAGLEWWSEAEKVNTNLCDNKLHHL